MRRWYRFKLLGDIHKLKGFRLVLCAHVLDPMVKCATEMLERLVEAGKVYGGRITSSASRWLSPRDSHCVLTGLILRRVWMGSGTDLPLNCNADENVVSFTLE